MINKKRLDLLLIDLGLSSSRNQAQQLIDNGQVYFEDGLEKTRLLKASLKLEPEMGAKIRVAHGEMNRFVSRGGLKLEGALKKLNLDVQGFFVLDIGISTGGFSDCLFQRGASQILGVDVGHGQLSDQLLAAKNLKLIEGLNARYLSESSSFLEHLPENGFDLIVMDVSFISITLILPQLIPFLKQSGFILSLVKPQFEVGLDGIGKNGIVKDSNLYREVENKIKQCCVSSGFVWIDYFESAIEGKDGNKEFFVFLKKK